MLLAAQLIAGRLMRQPTRASEGIVSAYAILVLFHAGYLELLPSRLAPWVAIAMLPAMALYSRGGRGSSPGVQLARLAVGAVFVLNYLRVTSGVSMTHVPAEGALRILYPIVLYVGYAVTRVEAMVLGLRQPLLYAAHLAAMVAVAWLVDTSFLTSVLWGCIAVTALVVALWLGDRTLGHSSFLVFAISGLKVLVYDLAGAVPLVRIGSLAALGVSLFVGGWLYQLLARSSNAPPTDDT